MRLVVRVIKKSKSHYYSRQLNYPRFDYGRSCEVSDAKHEKFIQATKWWNELFKIKYNDFRNGIESIVEDFNSNCKFDITVKHLDAIKALGSFNGWIVVVDEDNFIDKQLIPILRSVEDVNFSRWRVYRVGVDHFVKPWDECFPNILPTGGYAISANDGVIKHEKSLHCHGDAAGFINKFKLVGDEPFGLVMVHPSSHGVLSKLENKDDLSSLVKNFLSDHPYCNLKSRYKDHYNKIVDLYNSL